MHLARARRTLRVCARTWAYARARGREPGYLRSSPPAAHQLSASARAEGAQALRERLGDRNLLEPAAAVDHYELDLARPEHRVVAQAPAHPPPSLLSSCSSPPPPPSLPSEGGTPVPISTPSPTALSPVFQARCRRDPEAAARMGRLRERGGGGERGARGRFPSGRGFSGVRGFYEGCVCWREASDRSTATRMSTPRPRRPAGPSRGPRLPLWQFGPAVPDGRDGPPRRARARARVRTRIRARRSWCCCRRWSRGRTSWTRCSTECPSPSPSGGGADRALETLRKRGQATVPAGV